MTRTSSGLRSRQSGIRYGSSGSGTGAGPAPAPAPEHLNPGPDGRDLGPENEIPVSGFPLIAGSLYSTEPLSLRASRISSPSPSPVLTFALFAQAAGRFAPLHGMFVSHVPLSPCQHVPSRPLVASRFSDPIVRPDPVFGPVFGRYLRINFSLRTYFRQSFLEGRRQPSLDNSIKGPRE